MKTLLERFESAQGLVWGVVDLGTEDGDCVEFSTRAKATSFRQVVNSLAGTTVQAKYDSYAEGIIQSYVDRGFDYTSALFLADKRHF